MSERIIYVALLSALAGCNAECERIERTVVEVGDCTNAASNAWSGYDPGYCRVVFDNGNRMDIRRPVMVGDIYRDTVCRYE